MRPSQLLRPRYVADRVRLAMHQRLHPNAPWLTAEATSSLAQWLRPNHVGIEWGSGRSTLWFAERVGRLVSVEHDAGWHQAVFSQLEDAGSTNVDYRLLSRAKPERVETADWIIAMFASDYVRAVDAFAPQSLDFALVDGMYRSACALAVIPKLRSGGAAHRGQRELVPAVDEPGAKLARRRRFPALPDVGGVQTDCDRLGSAVDAERRR